MARMTGKKALLEMLTAEGVQYIFGNPGTSEGAIMDALEDYPNLQYILGTQEGVAMGAADTYARATGKPAFINLHIETGLANGISLLHNAAAGGTPLVLTAGNKDMRKLVEGRTPLADMVKLFTKWSVELTHPEQIPGAIRSKIAPNQNQCRCRVPSWVGAMGARGATLIKNITPPCAGRF